MSFILVLPFSYLNPLSKMSQFMATSFWLQCDITAEILSTTAEISESSDVRLTY